MSRPKNSRNVHTAPVMEGFRPFGIPTSELEPVVLSFDEYESMRLTDYEGLDQQQAAEKMKVSRPTFTRIYKSARRTIAKAFVEGKAIFIEGGTITSEENWYRCKKCGKLIVSHTQQHSCDCCPQAELKQLHAAAQDSDKTDCCICVHCGTKTPHNPGEPCRLINCSTCGKPMMREGSYHHRLFEQNKLKKQ